MFHLSVGQSLELCECVWSAWIRSMVLSFEGLPNREGPKPKEIGGGCSGGTFLGREVMAAGVTGSGLVNRSERSGR